MGIEIVLYIAALASMIFAVYTQVRVKSTFERFSRVRTMAGRRACEVAEMILRRGGVRDVRIERVAGSLTDHYDPRAKVLRLSDSVYDSYSSAAIGVAAHEAGHAVQYAKGYIPVKIRAVLVPAASFSSRFTWILILAGVLTMLLMQTPVLGFYIAIAGVGLFAVATLFQLVTLPCEFDASYRAMTALRECGWYSDSELAGSKRVLKAAAMTYVAALATSAIQLLRVLLYVMRVAGNRRR